MLLLVALLPLIGLSFVWAGVTSNASHVANRSFDYIILGGGTAGLALAGRLSEDPHVSVLVIEVGPDNRTSPLESVVNYPIGLSTALDWQYQTVDHKRIRGGKTLGGSSAINGGAWTRGQKAQYDAFTALLEPKDAGKGWDWQGLSHYMKKAEHFSPPDAIQRALGANFVEAFHGFEGPVHAAFPTKMYTGPANPLFVDTVRNLTGIRLIPDIHGGNANGAVYDPISLNKFNNDSRSSSAASYLTPVEDTRPIWVTLVEHTATRILFSNSSPLRAIGAEFAATPPANTTPSLSDTAIFTAYAKREFILAAGALRSPALLQLSGIGDAALLRSLCIDVLLNLKGVGRNLQEQTNTGLTAFGSARLAEEFGGGGPDTVVAFPSIYELFGTKARGKVDEIEKSLRGWAESQAHNTGADANALMDVFKLVTNAIVEDHAPIAELYYDLSMAPSTLKLATWNLLPFSRGSVSINSTNPFHQPSISVNWFSVPFDMTVQVAGARLIRQIFEAPPMRNITNGTLAIPTLGMVPQDATDEDWEEWILQAFEGNSHPIGTAAMMRRSLGGVVDAELRVYGTENLRVVDASIVPIQLSAHLSSTIYGIAEKAADIIKAAYKEDC
ncbi:unnamed protein product [Peniophora sp. CBMAI 1063]|nr:unnamed protein product [Peniophora sp. CBMAI 1063]